MHLYIKEHALIPVQMELTVYIIQYYKIRIVLHAHLIV